MRRDYNEIALAEIDHWSVSIRIHAFDVLHLEAFSNMLGEFVEYRQIAEHLTGVDEHTDFDMIDDSGWWEALEACRAIKKAIDMHQDPFKTELLFIAEDAINALEILEEYESLRNRLDNKNQ